MLALVRAKYFLFLAMALGSQAVVADVVTLQNGDRISGTIKSKASDTVVFESQYMGEITLPWSEITSLVTDQSIRLKLDGDRVVSGKVIPSEDGTLKLVAEDDLFETKPIPLTNITAINPVIEDGKAKIRGGINVGAASFTGNTDKKSFHADAEVIARSKNNRVTLGGALDWGEDDGTESTNNGIAYGKYDHFISDKWYAYANTSFEMDRFQDLDLRTTLGGGMGYQFIETDRTQLSFEAGPSFVNENYSIGQDNSFAAGRWAVRFEHWLYRDMLQFFHHHEGLLSFDNVSDYYIRSRTGLRVPLMKGFALTTEIDVDYDNVPSIGKDKTDTVYLINLGYGF